MKNHVKPGIQLTRICAKTSLHGTEHDHENRKNGQMCLQSSTMSEHIEITPEIIEIRHYLHAHSNAASRNTRPAPTLRSCCAQRHRSAQQSARNRRGRTDPRRPAGTTHRIARRHRRPAHPGRHRSAVLIRQRRRVQAAATTCTCRTCSVPRSGSPSAANTSRGSIKLLFQPAEELASARRPWSTRDCSPTYISRHRRAQQPNYAPGQIAVGPEPMMAGCVKFQ